MRDPLKKLIYIKKRKDLQSMWLKNIKVLKEGDSFGELSLLMQQKAARQASAITMEKTYLIYLERETFQTLMKDKEQEKMMEHI